MWKRFLFWMAVFFGLFLTVYTIRITVRERDMAKIESRRFQGKVLKVTSPDLFAERNIIEVFSKRYNGNIKFNFLNNTSAYIDLADIGDSSIIIYPSFAFKNLLDKKIIAPIEIDKVPNVKSLMDIAKKDISEKYTDKSVLAIPLAYVPYAMFFSVSQLKQSLSGKEIIALTPSIALADNVGSLLMLFKIYNLSPEEESIKKIEKELKGKKLYFYNPDDSVGMSNSLSEVKPKLIIGPSYNVNILTRDFGSFDMILPEEGTYADYYLMSLTNKGEDKEISHIFLNHYVEPLIHRNLVEIMGLGITNYTAMKNIKPALYNSLRMNDEKYLSAMEILKDSSELKKAELLFELFKKRTANLR